MRRFDVLVCFRMGPSNDLVVALLTTQFILQIYSAVLLRTFRSVGFGCVVKFVVLRWRDGYLWCLADSPFALQSFPSIKYPQSLIYTSALTSKHSYFDNAIGGRPNVIATPIAGYTNNHQHITQTLRITIITYHHEMNTNVWIRIVCASKYFSRIFVMMPVFRDAGSNWFNPNVHWNHTISQNAQNFFICSRWYVYKQHSILTYNPHCSILISDANGKKCHRQQTTMQMCTLLPPRASSVTTTTNKTTNYGRNNTNWK